MIGKQNTRGFLPLLCLVLFLLFISLSNIAFGDTIIVSGSGFDLYFPTDSELAFQHLEILYRVEGFNVTLTVDSGVLNGSGASLTMWTGSGILRFTSQNTSTLSLASSSDRVQFNVNGDRYSNPFNIVASDIVSIHWVIPAWNPIGAIMGLTGLGTMILAPTYAIFQIKKKKNYSWILFGLALFIIGWGLLVGWLS